jgi:ADP-ribose pyrophosphatase YjhB (NUDIX family)
MRVRISALIIKEDKILLINRIKLGQNYFVVPGGGLEAGETLEQGLIREMFEETSLTPLKYQYISENITDTQKIHYFLVTDFSGEAVLGGPEKERESKDNQYNLQWLNLSDFYTLQDPHYKIVQNILKQINHEARNL